MRGRVVLLGAVALIFGLLMERSAVAEPTQQFRGRRTDVTLSEEAAGALNSVFAVQAFSAGFPIGSAHTILKESDRL